MATFPSQVTGRAVDRLEPCGGGQNGIALWLLIQDRSRLHHPYYRRLIPNGQLERDRQKLGPCSWVELETSIITIGC